MSKKRGKKKRLPKSARHHKAWCAMRQNSKAPCSCGVEGRDR